MSIFSKESLDLLRQRVVLADVLSAHVELKPAGAAFKALCPFHDEKTPSFVVQKGDSHYHCFGCGAHGDAIQFLMAHLKMSFKDAVESLAQRFNVPLQLIEGDREEKGPNKGLLKEALEQACRFFHFMLLHTPEGHQALEYLYKRGLDLDFIKCFQLGLAPATAGKLRTVLHGKFIKDEAMLDAGLLVKKQDGYMRDFFSDRITFPIRDAAGAVIGFSARKYKEETFGGKYVNTAETALFKKSKVLFGLNYSRRRIAKERKAIIVEGQIDALQLIYAGFNITVAGQGTAFGDGHAKELISLGVNQVFLALDGDIAGQEATRKIGHFFQKAGVEVRVVQLPLGSDPDSFLKQQGPDEFIKLLKSSSDYITFLVQHHSHSFNMGTPAGKHQLVQEIAQQIRTWDHSVMVHESLRKLAHITNTPEEMLGVGQQYLPNLLIRKSGNIGLQKVDPDRIFETDFLRWLLLMGEGLPHLVELAQKNLTPEHLRVLLCRKLYEAYLECHIKQQPRDLLSICDVAQCLEDADAQELLNEIMQKKINRERANDYFKESIQKILDRNWMEECEGIRKKIQSGQCSEEEVLALAKQFDDLKRNKPVLAN